MSLMSFICFIIPTPLAPVLSARSRQWSTGALAVLLSRTESRGQTGPRAWMKDKFGAKIYLHRGHGTFRVVTADG